MTAVIGGRRCGLGKRLYLTAIRAIYLVCAARSQHNCHSRACVRVVCGIYARVCVCIRHVHVLIRYMPSVCAKCGCVRYSQRPRATCCKITDPLVSASGGLCRRWPSLYCALSLSLSYSTILSRHTFQQPPSVFSIITAAWPRAWRVSVADAPL
jgi:hypothetical protein